MTKDLKEDPSKQINEVKKSIQNLDKKVSIMEEKFSKEMEIIKNNQLEILEMKTSINQIQATIDSIISRQYQTEE
jgi:predicted  nucleic acid-binding Zn-ribbon protein